MNKQEIYAKGFKKGWDNCRARFCKEYHLDENKVIVDEETN